MPISIPPTSSLIFQHFYNPLFLPLSIIFVCYSSLHNLWINQYIHFSCMLLCATLSPTQSFVFFLPYNKIIRQLGHCCINWHINFTTHLTFFHASYNDLLMAYFCVVCLPHHFSSPTTISTLESIPIPRTQVVIHISCHVVCLFKCASSIIFLQAHFFIPCSYCFSCSTNLSQLD